MSKTYQKNPTCIVSNTLYLSLLHLLKKSVASPSLIMEMNEDIAWSTLLKYYVKLLGKWQALYQ